MEQNERNELSPSDRAAFAALPSERDPGDLLEERTVRALRRRGLLRFNSRRWPLWQFRYLATGIAASVALFVSGVAVGQWLGSRAVVGPMAEAQQQTALQAAAAVQRAGSAYVNALTALAALADSTENGAVEQGREAALTALYAAAYELSLLTPDDPIAVTIRERLERNEPGGRAGSDARLTRVVWF
jgi:hypothetical protein